MRKFSMVFGVLAVCFFAGYAAIFYTTDSYSVNRDPAAIRNGYDFSHLTGAALDTAVKQKLISGFELKRGPEGTGVGLGHFAYRNTPEGEKKLACQEFEMVTLRFEAEGAGVSGEGSVMEFEGRCQLSTDLAKINPLMIPVEKILGDRPADGDYEFDKNQPTEVTVRFTNLPDAWPRKWILKSVKLANVQKSEALIVDSEEISKYVGHPLMFSW